MLSVDGKEVDRKSMKHSTPITFPEDENFDIGQDTRTGVAMLEYRYECPFKFTGKINKVTFALGPEQFRKKNTNIFLRLPTRSPARRISQTKKWLNVAAVATRPRRTS